MSDPHDRPRLRPLRALMLYRAILIILWTLSLLMFNLRHVLRGTGLPSKVTIRWHSGVCRIAGIDVRTHGTPALGDGLLMVANHISYVDIIALGACLPCSFVAKSDVADWPVFGWMAKQQRTIFVERNPRRAADQMDPLRERLTQPENCVILFPEGTSCDGTQIKPFKSSLFQAAQLEVEGNGRTILVQPVTVSYTRLDGMPMGRAFRSFYAWYGDMELMPHLQQWLGIGQVGVDIIYHEPMRLGDLGSRKALAKACEAAVAFGLESTLRGEPQIKPARADFLNRESK